MNNTSSLPHLQSRNLSSYRSQIAHGFYTREGGISSGAFNSLNFRRCVAEQEEHLQKNKQLVRTALAPDKQNAPLITLHQLCQADVITVTEDNLYNLSTASPQPQGDALVTSLPQTIIAVKTADCVPILLYCPTKQIIAACHGSWTGLLADIISNTLQAMQSLGAQPEHIIASIGPCIQQSSFEVGAEVYQAFTQKFPLSDGFFTPPHNIKTGQRRLNLPQFTLWRLKTLGVTKVDNLDINTYTDPKRFFSYRRACHRGEENYGNQLSAIMLKGTEK